jgi:hypothetical protein
VHPWCLLEVSGLPRRQCVCSSLRAVALEECSVGDNPAVIPAEMTGNGPLPATLVNELQVARHDTEKQGRVPSGMFAEQLNRAQRLSAACPKLSLDIFKP